jgi:hypothetical protein
MIRTSYDPEADALFVWLGAEGSSPSTPRRWRRGDAGLRVQVNVIDAEVLDVRGCMAPHPAAPTEQPVIEKPAAE